MSHPAIEVSGLSKRYVIEHESRHDNLRDTLHHAARKLWRRARWGTGFEREEFWALRDVSFSIQPGEVVGVIGRNGAGKSTLLKILSRITEPSSGKIAIRGRVASLLEVGTGFHPDLTGRENIFLNGAILGMSRGEIRKKFDEIVAFAEVERFLDTPVKRYSSGMYVRLAFAVAAHLEPEILIVDEVLAVGDAQFQKKCIGKMQDVARGQGRTVLFVSHNLETMLQLTTKALLLQSGSVNFFGPTPEALSRYLQRRDDQIGNYVDASPGDAPRIARIDLKTSEGPGLQAHGAPLEIRFEIDLPRPVRQLCLSCYICNPSGQQIALVHRFDMDGASYPAGTPAVLTCRIPSLGLFQGGYHLRVYFAEARNGSVFKTIEHACPFEVVMTVPRAAWPWQPNECLYLETASWSRA